MRFRAVYVQGRIGILECIPTTPKEVGEKYTRVSDSRFLVTSDDRRSLLRIYGGHLYSPKDSVYPNILHAHRGDLSNIDLPPEAALLYGRDPDEVQRIEEVQIDVEHWDRVGTDFGTNMPIYRKRGTDIVRNTAHSMRERLIEELEDPSVHVDQPSLPPSIFSREYENQRRFG